MQREFVATKRGKAVRNLPVIVAIGALLLMAACDGREETTSRAQDPSRQAPADTAIAEKKVLNFYNWTDYIDPTVLDKFTAETGIKVNYDVYESNELLETKLLAGRSGYDVVVPGASFVERQIKAGIFGKLDRSRIPNWSHLDPEAMQRLAQYDPGNEHAVIYMWGTDGIGYNESRLKAIMPDAPIDSWALVFDPRIASQFGGCGISGLDAPTTLVPLVLAYLGRDPLSESRDDLERAEEALMGIRPYVRMIDNTVWVDALASGDICIAVGWNGAVLQARDKAAETGQDLIKYSIPKEGTMIWFDVLAIPKDAPHPDNAHAFINFLHRPDVAATNSNYLKFANGNAASLELVDEGVRIDPAIYPSAETRAALFPNFAGSEEYSRLLNRSWTRFVTGK